MALPNMVGTLSRYRGIFLKVQRSPDSPVSIAFEMGHHRASEHAGVRGASAAFCWCRDGSLW